MVLHLHLGRVTKSGLSVFPKSSNFELYNAIIWTGAFWSVIWCHLWFLSIWNNNLNGFPIKEITLEGYPLYHYLNLLDLSVLIVTREKRKTAFYFLSYFFTDSKDSLSYDARNDMFVLVMPWCAKRKSQLKHHSINFNMEFKKKNWKKNIWSYIQTYACTWEQQWWIWLMLDTSKVMVTIKMSSWDHISMVQSGH